MSRAILRPMAVVFFCFLVSGGCSVLVRSELDKKKKGPDGGTADQGQVERDQGASDGVQPLDSYVPPMDGYAPPTDGYVPPKDGYVPPKDGFLPPIKGIGPCRFTDFGIELYVPGRNSFQAAKGDDGHVHIAYVGKNGRLLYQRVDPSRPDDGHEIEVDGARPASFALAVVGTEAVVVFISGGTQRLQVATIQGTTVATTSPVDALVAGIQPREVAAAGSGNAMVILVSGDSGATLLHRRGGAASTGFAGCPIGGERVPYRYPRVAFSAEGNNVVASVFKDSGSDRGWRFMFGGAAKFCGAGFGESSQFLPAEFMGAPAEVAIEEDSDAPAGFVVHVALVEARSGAGPSGAPGGLLFYRNSAMPNGELPEVVAFGVDPESISLGLQLRDEDRRKRRPVLAYNLSGANRRLFWHPLPSVKDTTFLPPYGGPKGMGSGIFVLPSQGRSIAGGAPMPPLHLVADAYRQGKQTLLFGQCDIRKPFCEQPAAGNGGVPARGLRDFGEACDGDDFGGIACETLFKGSGKLACSEACMRLDSRDCGLLAHWNFEEFQPGSYQRSWNARRDTITVADCVRGACLKSAAANNSGSTGYYLPFNTDQKLEIPRMPSYPYFEDSFAVGFYLNFSPPAVASITEGVIQIVGLNGREIRCGLTSTSAGSTSPTFLRCELFRKGVSLGEMQGVFNTGAAWNHIVVQVRPGDGQRRSELQLFIDGRDSGRLPFSRESAGFRPQSITFGSLGPVGASDGFQGGIDEITIYGRPLDFDEVDLYRQDPRPPEPNASGSRP